MYFSSIKHKKTGVTILTLQEYFRMNTIIRNEERIFIMIKESSRQGKTILNVYLPSEKAPRHMKKKLRRLKIERQIHKVGDFNTLLTGIYKTEKKAEISEDLNSYQPTDITDI